jgi:hypothetical protein
MYSTQYYTFIKLVESVHLNNLNLEMMLAYSDGGVVKTQ